MKSLVWKTYEFELMSKLFRGTFDTTRAVRYLLSKKLISARAFVPAAWLVCLETRKLKSGKGVSQPSGTGTEARNTWDGSSFFFTAVPLPAVLEQWARV